MKKLDLYKAIKALKNGQIIVYPTDTLYGLGADIFNDDAVKKVFKIKKRETTNPLPVAVADVNDLEKIAIVDERTRDLIKKFLPGKLTIVLKKKNNVSDLVTGGLDKVAVRIPNNKIALYLLSNFGPLTATSANIHGKKPPVNINEISIQFKSSDIAVYIDDGILDGKPSTIVDMTVKPFKIIRKGAISEKEIMDVISYE
ncbi:MAG: L-threonylcarbamoyladenylate synthase [Candidatus Thermoplasmatota archaeon]|jgi:L-threonylcarbamoyladenylate synthase|nr:L-threonylcarbamoyladenylate synthase [Candidatus Thermoplasmatota archaeon]